MTRKEKQLAVKKEIEDKASVIGQKINKQISDIIVKHLDNNKPTPEDDLTETILHILYKKEKEIDSFIATCCMKEYQKPQESSKGMRLIHEVFALRANPHIPIQVAGCNVKPDVWENAPDEYQDTIRKAIEIFRMIKPTE